MSEQTVIHDLISAWFSISEQDRGAGKRRSLVVIVTDHQQPAFLGEELTSGNAAKFERALQEIGGLFDRPGGLESIDGLPGRDLDDVLRRFGASIG